LRILAHADPREVEYQKQLQKRIEDNAKRQLELERQLAERDQRIFDVTRQVVVGTGRDAVSLAGAVGVPGLTGPAVAGAGLATQLALANFDRETARVLSNAQQVLDQFVRLLNDASQRIQEIEGAQRQADAANTK
jgi:cell division septum initiation protein DivIVA